MLELIRRIIKIERDCMLLRCGRVLVWLACKLDDAQVWCIRKARKILQKLKESE